MSSTLQDSLLRSACQLIETWTGISLGAAAPHRLVNFLEHRAEALGMRSGWDYLNAARALPADAPERQQLINLVTNGLTAFWRDEPQLDAFHHALNSLGTTHTLGGAPIHVWCAGCSTGEEAYTLAMIAQEAQLPVQILGTDLNTDSLEHARRGIYGAWSMRRIPPERLQRHFTQLSPDSWEVSPALRSMVQLRRHNLVEAAPRLHSRPYWDIIICRNVLIYFAEESLRKTLGHFSGALQPNGYLMVGSSEQLPDSLHTPFRAARHGAGFVYRLATTPPGRTAYGIPRIAENQIFSRIDEDTLELDTEEVTISLIKTAFEHHRRKQPEDALACCEAAACYDPFIPELYLFTATLLAASGEPQRALEALRKALFIYPTLWPAALQMAQIYEHLGDASRARAAWRQCLSGIRLDPTPAMEHPAIAALYRDTIARRVQLQTACEHALGVR
jgi:chemotaxis protein methyltransferase CheR